MANAQDEHLVLLIFGHGDEDASSVSVGGGKSPEEAPLLYIRDMNRLLLKSLNVTQIITFCYSKGWLVLPDVAKSGQYRTQQGIAASAKNKTSQPWPVSKK